MPIRKKRSIKRRKINLIRKFKVKYKKKSDNKLFELSWSSFDEKVYYLYLHQNKTEEQFKKDVVHLLKKYGDDYLDNEFSWAGANEWIYFISKKMPELGYKPVTPIKENFFGSFIIETNTEKDDINWGKIVGEELLQKAIAHNQRIKYELKNRINN